MEKKAISQKGCFLCFIILVSTILSSTTTFAATIRVPADYQLIQTAIDAAADGDTVLVANGTYKGVGNKNLDFRGKPITVRSENGPEKSIIDSEGRGTGFAFWGEGNDSILSGFTITNGDSYSGAGGIDIRYSSPTINNCIITNNKGTSFFGGGGIFVDLSSSPTIINCIITDNNASIGGGILVWRLSSPTITNCIISSNIAERGAGIYVHAGIDGSSATIKNCTISKNISTISGAGIFSNSLDLTITNSIIWENSPDEIAPFSSDYVITYSDIQRGVDGEGNINADPQFFGNGDYHLTALSPCIDKGTSVGAPSYDIDGDQRPLGAGYDMGADEYPSAKIMPKAKPWIPLLLLND